MDLAEENGIEAEFCLFAAPSDSALLPDSQPLAVVRYGAAEAFL